MYYVMRAPSLHGESTDSLIECIETDTLIIYDCHQCATMHRGGNRSFAIIYTYYANYHKMSAPLHNMNSTT